MTEHPRSGYDALELIGELYDAVPAYNARNDVAFYVEESRLAGGETLEIGCGTGRVLLPIARTGMRITGIDESPRMLDRCRLRLEQEPESARACASLRQADMRNFHLGKTFALATIPFRPFQHLLRVDDQTAALHAIHRHLDPGGRLVFDVFNPDMRLLVKDRTAETEDTPETKLPDGRSFRRASRVIEVHPARQVSDVELIYYLTAGASEEVRLVHAFSMRWYWRYEVEHLLARCGFDLVMIYGNFDRSPLNEGSPEMIFVAERH
ncbi:MAG: class I SAM-dependent methyltransferase [Gemmatimonadaceae bacterium]|nr:class I SAM-dependent methyltransferase [Gemmatimonadaceae bacterium]